MGTYLKNKQVVYEQIIHIVVADNPILEVALLLIPRFAGDSTMQGGE